MTTIFIIIYILNFWKNIFKKNIREEIYEDT